MIWEPGAAWQFASDDLGAVHSWALNWNSVLDLEITAVLDDDEAKAVAKSKFGL